MSRESMPTLFDGSEFEVRVTVKGLCARLFLSSI